MSQTATQPNASEWINDGYSHRRKVGRCQLWASGCEMEMWSAVISTDDVLRLTVRVSGRADTLDEAKAAAERAVAAVEAAFEALS